MKVRLIVACFLAAIFSYVPSASALTFDLNIPFGLEGADPTLPEPLFKAVFDGSAGSVQLTLSAPNLPINSYVTEWYFNVRSEIGKPTQLGLPTDPRLQNFLLNPNELNAGPKGAALGFGFDFRMLFSGTGDLFESKETATFLFSAPGTITADWFNELNVAGAFYAAANIVTLGQAGEKWIASGPVTPPKPGPNPVPEPGTMLLFGFGLIGLAFSGGRNLLK